MGTVAKNKGGDFTPAPADNHVARCYRVIDLGTQHNEMYDKWQPKIMLAWELPLATFDSDDGPKPFSVAKIYTLSLNEKAALRQHLESWRGRQFTEDEMDGFDVKNILGAPCLLNVVHHKKQSGDVRAVVSSISKLPKGMDCPAAVNAPQYFNIDAPDMEMYESFSDGIKKMVGASREWRGEPKRPEEGENQPVAAGDDLDDDIPF